MARRFFLRFTGISFTGNGTYDSGVIDLYDNDTYKNYSTIKSTYGTQLIDGLWTGRESTGTNETESGFVESGRFIDTTGTLSLGQWFVTDADSSANYTLKLKAWTSDDDTFIDGATDGEVVEDLDPGQIIDFASYKRYLRFELDCTAVSGQNVDINELLIAVNIQHGTQLPMYRRALDSLQKLPSWMAMHEQHATPESSTPYTLGGQFYTAAVGEFLEDLWDSLDYVDKQRFIDLADPDILTWVYKAEIGPTVHVWEVKDIRHDIVLGQAIDPEEFMSSTNSEYVYLWDSRGGVVYVNRLYQGSGVDPADLISINGTNYTLTPHHVWNSFDEFGLILDTPRLHLESNRHYKARLLDVYQNRPGSSKDRIKYGVRRELDLWSLESSTPSLDAFSGYEGATPELLELADLKRDDRFFDNAGFPTSKMIAVIDELRELAPTTWGFFRYDNALFDVGGTNAEGYEEVPGLYDATPVTGLNFQAGVGDGSDLYPYAPNEDPPHQTFKPTFILRGYKETDQAQFPTVRVEYRVWGEADKTVFDNPEQNFALTLETRDNDATPRDIYQVFRGVVRSDVDSFQATPSYGGQVEINIYGPTGDFFQEWKIKDDGADIDIDPAEITENFTLKLGAWDVGTQTYVDVPSTSNIRAFFTDDETDDTSSGTPEMPKENYGSIVVESLVTSSSVQTWRSEPTIRNIEINNGTATAISTVDPPPQVMWDSNLEDPPNKEYKLEILSNDGAGTPSFGGWSTDEDGDEVFVPLSELTINGSPATSTLTLTSDTQSITWESSHSITGKTLTFFENRYTPSETGSINEDGIVRDDGITFEGQNAWKRFDLDRADFGVASTADHRVVWLGVESNNQRVDLWLDSNDVPEFANELGTYLVNARYDVQFEFGLRMESGHFFDEDDHYYVFSRPKEQVETDTSESTFVLAELPKPHAPIIVKAENSSGNTIREYRRVVSYDSSTPMLLMQIVEELDGTDSNDLFVAYSGVHNAYVERIATGVVSGPFDSDTNVIDVGFTTNGDEKYEVRYMVDRAFSVEFYDQATPQARVLLTETADDLGADQIRITYETGDDATPTNILIDPYRVPLNRGVVYISDKDYDLQTISMRLSPGSVVANQNDYITVTLIAIDTNGNPRPGTQITVTTTDGSFMSFSATPSIVSTAVLRTDVTGRAYIRLVGPSSVASKKIAEVTATSGSVEARANFIIRPTVSGYKKLYAVADPELVPCDPASQVVVKGRILDESFDPEQDAEIRWARARTHQELFDGNPYQEDVVYSDDKGYFEIGPFHGSATPGMWFVSLESDRYDGEGSATFEETGDLVGWMEYHSKIGADIYRRSNVPTHATPTSVLRAGHWDAATPIRDWSPPPWYPIPPHVQVRDLPRPGFTLRNITPNQMSQTGTWTRRTDVAPWPKYHWISDNASDELSFSFTGHALRVWTYVGPDQGKLEVRIDTTLVDTVDLYRRHRRAMFLAFEDMELSAGSHDVELTVANTKNAQSSGFEVGVIKAQYGTHKVEYFSSRYRDDRAL